MKPDDKTLRLHNLNTNKRFDKFEIAQRFRV
jgi:hypothetical protein